MGARGRRGRRPTPAVLRGLRPNFWLIARRRAYSVRVVQAHDAEMAQSTSSSHLSRAADPLPRPRLLRSAYTVAAVGSALIAYVGLEWASFIHEYKGVPITPWNPGLGVMFGLMVFVGPRAGVLLFAGTVAAEIFVLQTDLDLPMVIAIGLLTARELWRNCRARAARVEIRR